MDRNITYKELKMNDGTTVNLTLNYGDLLRIRAARPDAYEMYNNVRMQGVNDELDHVAIVYAAYLCGLPVDELPNAMTMEDFAYAMPENHLTLVDVVAALLVGKKK